MPEVRLAKFIAHAGICSRRHAEQLIQAGRVKVNGQITTKVETKVALTEKIEIDGQPIKRPPRTRIWLFHKPVGFITSHKAQGTSPIIFSILPDECQCLKTVGRLDQNTEGLLLLTNDGDLARFMELPHHHITRTYHIRFFGRLPRDFFSALKEGPKIEGICYQPILARQLKQGATNQWIELQLHEGKNREIRKIFQHYGLKISRLIRVAYGPFHLEALPKGEVKEIDEHDTVLSLQALGYLRKEPCVL